MKTNVVDFFIFITFCRFMAIIKKKLLGNSFSLKISFKPNFLSEITYDCNEQSNFFGQSYLHR